MSIERCVVVGGTHGNEYCGAFLARHWRDHPEELRRPGLDVEAVLANPEAHRLVRRYRDQDLNRCFAPKDLEAAAAGARPGVYEATRAVELKAQLLAGRDPAKVAIFDLHTTTANMGASVVVGKMTPFNASLAAWLQRDDPEVRVYRWVEEGTEPGFLSGVCDNGFNVEVGPVPNGVLRADMVELSRSLVARCLDFVGRWNGGERFAELELTLFEHREHVDFPRDASGAPSGFVHAERQDRDWQPLSPGDPLFQTFTGETLRYEGPAGRVPVFINECAYYEKHIALTLTERVVRRVGELAPAIEGPRASPSAG